jgi:hypothetical protein
MDALDRFDIEWFDSKREPHEPPDPRYPKGIDLNCAGFAAKTCCAGLPYPAKRCGVYLVKCRVCQTTAVVTTAGRPDDPRSVTVACRAKGH